MAKIDLDVFLKVNNITSEMWDKSETTTSELEKIEVDFQKLKPLLEQVAVSVVGLLQKHKYVHSVRWRIKDADHLLAKIVRKRAEGKEKYKTLTPENYTEVITDLVGVRILHLFKDEWSEIQKYVDECWEITEGPTAFIRNGDDDTKFCGCTVEIHKDDYRSIHSIIQSNLVKRPTNIEVQIRTIYEEAWSEIDHRVRYPNYSDNEKLKFFLRILNGLSGNADEMGSFVNLLSNDIKRNELMEEQIALHKDALNTANAVRKEQLEEIRKLAEENSEIQAALDKISEADTDITTLERSNQATAPVDLYTRKYKQFIVDAFKGSYEKNCLTDAISSLDGSKSLVDAANQLRGTHSLTDSLDGSKSLADAVYQLRGTQFLTDAISSLDGSKSLVDAANQLRGTHSLSDEISRTDKSLSLADAAIKTKAQSKK